ncbi:MAG TPA: hypothetical protein PK772_09255 [Chitinophagaceae bacterium]|nr:hypothetical protein [Chitinophagaceae bacterium]
MEPAKNINVQRFIRFIIYMKEIFILLLLGCTVLFVNGTTDNNSAIVGEKLIGKCKQHTHHAIKDSIKTFEITAEKLHEDIMLLKADKRKLTD